MRVFSSSIGFRTPGAFGPWRRKGVYIPIGRRIAPAVQIVKLWAEGLTAREIANAIGPIKGTRLQTAAVYAVVRAARANGSPELLRRALPVPEDNCELPAWKQRALGL